jgi:hypothetical protein
LPFWLGGVVLLFLAAVLVIIQRGGGDPLDIRPEVFAADWVPEAEPETALPEVIWLEAPSWDASPSASEEPAVPPAPKAARRKSAKPQAARVAPKEKKDPSAAFFAACPVVRLDIQVEEPDLSELLRDDRTYVRASVRELRADGSELKVYSEVGIHVKGARGSYRSFHANPALTLNFDKFTKGQKFHGIDKLHLNNSVQDRSYLCELLSGELFRAAGVPATRVAFALVTVNRRPRGLYVLKEGFDRTFLARHFTQRDGNLYDGGFIQDVDRPLQKRSGTGPDDHSDLARLVDAASELDPAQRLARLQEVLDLDRFLSFVAVESLTWHWDGYAMKTNNYRVYHDPASDRFVFLPHGTDQMFGHAWGPIVPDADGLVARAVLSTETGLDRYRRRLGELAERIFDPEAISRRIDEVAPIIRGALEDLGEGAAVRHDAEVEDLRGRIAERARAVRAILAGAEPEPGHRGRRRRGGGGARGPRGERGFEGIPGERWR